ncbi:GNAT family N-acetyltransferase [Clostridium estertheticum]|uniref:GNAT family N-acetyltransferase n=1 Tax=Clostridium estertheticum TaxID=238834 RepID=UPI0013EEA056|nr:GNAT family N-acetyltransferase [Clostridium estertheticum]MBZ9608555.1 GNAT family N-acetyltransferase [Clostridium estertheticum]
MFNIDIKFDDVSIMNVEKEDILKIKNWTNKQQAFNIEARLNYDIKEFYERYLECYVSEGEYFLKVLHGSELIGIIKGRIEFKNPNEVWIMCYLIEIRLYDADISNIIINEFSKHLHENYGMCHFYTFVSSNNNAMVEFWKRNNFEESRVTSNFFKINSEDKDIIILKKTI